MDQGRTHLNDLFRLISLPLIGAVIAIVAGVIFSRRVGSNDSKTDGVPGVNVHAWYLSGILAFLLVCALAVDWGSIAELATILSFAVGLASLILALIAIIQALTSTSDVRNSLAAVRTAADNISQSTAGLASSVLLIERAADAVQASATTAIGAVADIADVKGELIASSEAGRNAIAALRVDLQSKQSLSSSPNPGATPAAASEFSSMSMGGAAALYAAIRSFETSKPFVLSDVLPEEKSLGFEEGYLYALKNIGLIAFSEQGGAMSVSDLKVDLAKTRDLILNVPFTKESTQTRNERRIEQVEAYFKESGS